MKYIDYFKLALISLKRNISRSILTMLGIIIGVSAVILLVSIGTGIQNYITKQFEDLGANIIIVMPGKLLSEDGGFAGTHGAPNFAGSKLTLDLARGIQRLGLPVEKTAGVIETATTITYQGKTIFTTAIGVSENYSEVRNTKSQKGRFISASDVSSSKKVVIIGPTVVEKLYKNNNPLNTSLRVGNTNFKVVGITEKKGAGMGIDIDNSIYLPVTSAQKLFNMRSLQTITIKANSKENIQKAISMTNNYLSKRLKDDEFSVLDQGELVKTIEQILATLTVALGGIAAISLLVGGIGIMNIMLVSVTERTHEIGLRKAVGAKPKDILYQFLIEAVVLSVAGGVIGILLGMAGSIALSKFLSSVVTLWSVLLAFGFSALVGIVFGVAPAIKASRLNPIDALRYE